MSASEWVSERVSDSVGGNIKSVVIKWIVLSVQVSCAAKWQVILWTVSVWKHCVHFTTLYQTCVCTYSKEGQTDVQ